MRRIAENKKSRQAKNRGAEGGSWCEKEEAGEEPVKVGWTCGTNGGERLTKIADALRVGGRRRRGRPRLRWEDTMKTDLAGVDTATKRDQ